MVGKSAVGTQTSWLGFRVLVERSCRNPAAFVVASSDQREPEWGICRRSRRRGLLSQNQMVAAPRMVGPGGAVGSVRPAEVGQGEARDLRGALISAVAW